MLKIYNTINDQLTEIDSLTEKGIWVNLIAPTETELTDVCSATNILPDLLHAALDEEERSRIEVEADQLLILINVPISESTNKNHIYDTIPLGIIVSKNAIVTVSLKDNLIIRAFKASKPKSFYTFKQTRFVLQLLFSTASHYLKYLKQIDKLSTEIEVRLHQSMRNEELIQLLNLSKSLTYFITSLRANEIVMERLLKSHLIKLDPDMQLTSQILKMYPDDEDLLEDVITENKQAIEMAETYNNILSATMDAFASLISNNLNIVMKFLTSITIVMALPTMVASFFGMNVELPFQHSPFAFTIAIGLSIILSVIGVILLQRKNMF